MFAALIAVCRRVVCTEEQLLCCDMWSMHASVYTIFAKLVYKSAVWSLVTARCCCGTSEQHDCRTVQATVIITNNNSDLVKDVMHI